MIRTVIVDDEPIALEKLKNYVNKIPALELSGIYSNGFEAIEFLNANDVDLIISDINMPDLNGLDFIKTLSHPPMVIFTTAYPQFAVDSYKVSAVDYILKPYDFVEFSRAVNKAVESFMLRNSMKTGRSVPTDSSSLFIKVDYRYIRVSLSDIRFIKGYGEYLQIFTEGAATPFLTLSSFAKIKDCLPDNFLQVHRSYIVNMDKIGRVEKNRLVMECDNIIPLGDSYKSVFQEYLARHSVGRS